MNRIILLKIAVVFAHARNSILIKMIEEVEQILIGSLFGDGSLERNKSESKGIRKTKPVGIRFKERHSMKQKEYLLWKKEILSKMFAIKKYFSENAITIYSNVSPLLEEYHSHFYPSGKGYKVFNLLMLNKLKPLGLAIWYMDDGHFNKRSYSSEIACDTKNAEIIKSWFNEKYNMDVKISLSEGPLGISAKIIFNKEDTKRFFRMIFYFIHPSMKYKIKRTKEDMSVIRGYGRNYQRRKSKSDKQRL